MRTPGGATYFAKMARAVRRRIANPDGNCESFLTLHITFACS
jgi:hypothetical protein